MCRGGLKEPLKLPLHEAVRLECVENVPLSFSSLFEMFFMLANLCMVKAGGALDWKESFNGDVEELSSVDEGFCSSFTGVSTACSALDIGAGTKNFGLPPLGNLTVGTEGGWIALVAFPSLLLKVSTYLQQKQKS